MRKHKGPPVLRWLLLTAVGLLLGGNLYLLNANRLVGNRLPMPFGLGGAVVLSGSMEPTLSAGDLIIVRQAQSYTPGQIVVYDDGSALVVHRLLALEDGQAITQGDANNVPDRPIDQSRLRGIVIAHIPGLGNLLRVLRRPPVTAGLLILALWLAERSFRRERAQEEQTREAVKEEIRRLKDELNQ